jgi:hypothetical protein
MQSFTHLIVDLINAVGERGSGVASRHRLLQTARSAAKKTENLDKIPLASEASARFARWVEDMAAGEARLPMLGSAGGSAHRFPRGGPTPREQSHRSLPDNNHNEGLFSDYSSLALEVPSP